MHKTRPWTAIVPVRGGSKGLPGKNTRPLAGKPLYRHAVDVALAAGASRVIISTDIADIRRAQHPEPVQVLERPAALCADNTPMAPVVLHALDVAAVQGTVVLLQATSPMRVADDVQAALVRFAAGSFDVVMSVTEAERSVLKWGQVQADGAFVPLSLPEHCFSNRQSLPPVFRPNGAVYVFDAAAFVHNGGFVSQRLGTVIMPPERSHDIDTLADFEHCEALLSAPQKAFEA
jgi:CMP-N-acetylneuraminic acid synthetase